METHEPQAGPLLVFGGRPLLASQHITSFPAPSFQPPTLVQSITSRTPGFKSCSAIMRSAIWGHLLTLSAPQFLHLYNGVRDSEPHSFALMIR